MKFDKNFGYTRDLDKPHSDDEGDPNKGTMVEFFETRQPRHGLRGEPILDDKGEPVMSDAILMMKFYTTHDPKTVPIRKATEMDKREFKRAYELFVQGRNFTEQAGTPLDVLPDIDIMNRAMLNSQGIFSVEQLSDMNNATLSPDVRNWVNKARTYRLQNKPKPNQELLDEMAAMRAELASLKADRSAKTNPKTQEAKGIAA